jgi:hypothetical protein
MRRAQWPEAKLDSHGRLRSLPLDLTVAFDTPDHGYQSTEGKALWVLETSRRSKWVNALVLESTGVSNQYSRVAFATWHARDEES